MHSYSPPSYPPFTAHFQLKDEDKNQIEFLLYLMMLFLAIFLVAIRHKRNDFINDNAGDFTLLFS